eukprot:gene10096-2516_t
MLKRTSKLISNCYELNKVQAIRSYSTIDSSQIRLQIIKENRDRALKDKIEEKLKKKKLVEQERKAKKAIKLENEQKVKNIKRESAAKLRKLQKEEKQKVLEKLKKQKEREWISNLKKKEKESFQQMKTKLQEKKKRKKNTDLPRRAKSAFVWFYSKNFKSIAADIKTDENMKVTDVLKEAKKRFDSLSEEDSELYKVLAEQDQIRYKEEKKKYDSTKQANKPHKIISSYMRFFKQVRPEIVEANPEMKITDVAKAVGEKWRALSDAEKRPFIQEYEKEKKEYYENMEFEDDMEDESE